LLKKAASFFSGATSTVHETSIDGIIINKTNRLSCAKQLENATHPSSFLNLIIFFLFADLNGGLCASTARVILIDTFFKAFLPRQISLSSFEDTNLLDFMSTLYAVRIYSSFPMDDFKPDL
jgi:hypothetical protein